MSRPHSATRLSSREGSWNKQGKYKQSRVSLRKIVNRFELTMPTLNLSTNVPVDSVVSSDILKDASKSVARIIGKPESYVMILLKGGVPMSFGGSEEPAAYGELVSIGGLGQGVNGKLSAAIADILESKLSVDKSRFYIKFYDVEGSYFGFRGSTF